MHGHITQIQENNASMSLTILVVDPCNKISHTINACTQCGFRINANLVKEGSFRINAKLVKEELMRLWV